MHRDTKLRLIREAPLFADCTTAELAEIAAIADEIDFQPGKLLTREDAVGHEFVVLLEGDATVVRAGDEVATLHAGDWLGEVALLTGQRRNASVVVTTGAHALVIEGHRFLQLLEHIPSVRARVEAGLLGRTA